MSEDKFKRLAEIDAMVERMRSSASVEELPEGDLLSMMEVAVKSLGPRPQSEFRANSRTIEMWASYYFPVPVRRINRDAPLIWNHN